MDSIVWVIAIIIAVVAAVFGGIYIVLPAAIKKGVNVSGSLDMAQKVTSTASMIADGLDKVLPDSKALDVVQKIIEYSVEAVDAAEQMWKASQIEANERKEAAVKLTYDMLALANIDVTDQVKRVVDGAIEAAVLFTPHEALDEPIDNSDESADATDEVLDE